jgi:hypothetical protein
LFCGEVQKIKEAVVAFDVAEDVSDIRAIRKKRIQGFNQFAFILEEALVSFRLSSRARCPGLDSNNVVARFAACFRSAGEMDQVAASARCLIEFARRLAHALANARRRLCATRESARRLKRCAKMQGRLAPTAYAVMTQHAQGGFQRKKIGRQPIMHKWASSARRVSRMKCSRYLVSRADSFFFAKPPNQGAPSRSKGFHFRMPIQSR